MVWACPRTARLLWDKVIPAGARPIAGRKVAAWSVSGFFLGNLDPVDTREFVKHRLRSAGLAPDREIFSMRAFEKIHRVSEGCPRVICSIADLALVVGRGAGVRQIAEPQIAQARADMDPGSSSDGYHYYTFVRGVLDAEPPTAPDPQSDDSSGSSSSARSSRTIS